MKTIMFILIALLGLSTAAQAEPPAFAQRDQIKHLAHELAEAAHYAHENAEGYSHHDNYREARALEALHQLDRQARRFNRKVRRNYRRPHHTEHAYRDLMRTYREAQRKVRQAHTEESILHDMRHMGRLLNRMAYFYDGYGHHGDYGPTRRNDHYRGNDYDDGYYGKNRGGDYDDRYYGKKRRATRLKTPRRSTARY